MRRGSHFAGDETSLSTICLPSQPALPAVPTIALLDLGLAGRLLEDPGQEPRRPRRPRGAAFREAFGSASCGSLHSRGRTGQADGQLRSLVALLI
ncbi:Lim Homeobox Transcription Factor 1-Beta [Manis pentadactyla]|nr:Lim Homeobox Transcription Factor 1-Beta [Manis pentadactyla]